MCHSMMDIVTACNQIHLRVQGCITDVLHGDIGTSPITWSCGHVIVLLMLHNFTNNAQIFEPIPIFEGSALAL